MKKSRNSYFFIFLLCCFSSCSNPYTNDLKNAKYSETVTELHFQELQIEPLIGRPNQIKLLNDLLIIADYVDEKIVLLYDLTDSSYVRVLSMGQGPQELLMPVEIDVIEADSMLYVMQRQNGECRAYKIGDLLHSDVSQYKRIQLGMADRFLPYDGGYFCLGMYEKGVIASWDGMGKELGYINPYPNFKVEDISDKYRLFQGRLGYNRRTKIVMYAPSYTSDIQFYKQSGGSWIKQRIFYIGDGKIEKRIEEKGNLAFQKDDILNCIAACSTEDFFYVLYSGENMGESNSVEEHFVLRFDAEGKFDMLYKVNPTVKSICVSEDDSMMYVLMIGKSGEYAIGRTHL